MNIIVLMKQVPEIEKVRFDPEKGRLDRSSAGATTNPFDLNALEAAVQIKEKVGGIVTAISMGPMKAEEMLRDALARGADKAILLSDERFAGADTLATAYTLAAAIRKLGAFDLVICGEKTVDGDTAQVGPEVAEFLNIPHAAYVEEILNVSENNIVVKARMERSHYIMRLTLPALITVTKDVNTPRLPTLRDKIRAMRAPITIWRYEDLEEVADPRYFGFDGSPTRVIKVYTPSAEKRLGKMISGSPEEVAREIVHVLIKNKIL
ncbi:electron transfer flavoprotein subunit beta/FixA family protein [Candidatus Bathyarchaeota archaeon]|nr:electron transfer flavoprotein subunit beta/FixA family protein [Candidatus Bathyarchaeota archaeon]